MSYCPRAFFFFFGGGGVGEEKGPSPPLPLARPDTQVGCLFIMTRPYLLRAILDTSLAREDSKIANFFHNHAFKNVKQCIRQCL